MRHKHWSVVPGLAALSLLLATGCTAASSSSGGGTTLRITERDFHIAAPRQLSSGDVRLLVRNAGPDQHELLVIRSRAQRLPLRRDGVTVNEEGLQRVIVGQLDPGRPGSVRELRLHLPPGRYVLICNMAGHYLSGMHSVLVVR